ncbi:MAG: DNA recombination protein RmuC [Bacteroidia bacterium]|jgi:DNA recombination protein RmuC
MEFLFLIVGLLAGFALAWFIRKPPVVADLTSELTQLRNQLMKAVEEGSAFRSTNEMLLTEKKTLTETLAHVQDKLYRLNADFSTAENVNKNLKEKLDEQQEELTRLQEKFQKEFENLANRILDEKSKKFTEQNRANLDQILLPFQQKIKEFETKVDTAFKEEMRDKISLREEVKKLFDLNQKITEETHNLTKALKGDTKKQGNWGELILEKVLERSGLENNREYRTQVVTKNVEGDTIKPDVVVFLPDSKHLIIDAKVSLTAYEQYSSSDDTEQRTRLIKEHVNSVRSHVKLLSDKNYYSSTDFSTPDFVLLFMPMESAFSIAIQEDPELFAYAWDRKTVIVSPTTLLATLRTIASLWKMEHQNRNALQIAEEAGKLYDKFEGLMRDLTEIGKKMDDSKRAYEDAMRKISTGPGNLVGKVEILRKLGAKATKTLPPNLLDRSGEA